MSFRFPGLERPVHLNARFLLLGVLCLVVLIWAGYLLFSLVTTEHKIHRDIPRQANSIITPPRGTQPVIVFPTEPATTPTAVGPTSTPSPTEAMTATPTAAVTSTPALPNGNIKSWHGKKKINVLVVGIDKRYAGERSRTDTIILASLDFQHNEINVVSIPRDLYVQLPGSLGYWKINAAYPLGENEKYSKQYGGGLGLLILTLRQDFGLQSIDEYAVVDFNGFVEGIDAIGGIDINVPRRLVDPAYPTKDYKTKRVVFEAGPQHMNGERALEYARTRHPDSDFGRMKRQQQVLLAVEQKVKHDPSLLLKAPKLLRVMGDNMQTSLNFREQLRLASWATSVPKKNIHFYSIEGPIGNTQDGASVVWPQWDNINQILHKVFGPHAGHKG